MINSLDSVSSPEASPAAQSRKYFVKLFKYLIASPIHYSLFHTPNDVHYVVVTGQKTRTDTAGNEICDYTIHDPGSDDAPAFLSKYSVWELRRFRK